MAMNPMQKKARTSFLLGMFLTLVITGLIIGFLIFQLGQIKQKEAAIVYKQVYVTSQEIVSGGKINGSVALKTLDSTIVPNNAVTALDAFTYITDVATTKIGLKAGTVLTTDMISLDGQTESADVRLQEYNMIVLPTQLKNGEYVDIRLQLPSGENYIVLSKKYVENSDANTIWIKVREDEILTMSNAIVEAYIMEGSLLYATTYTDAGMQNAATPTYVAKNSVINLMNTDPNITTTAKAALVARYTEDARNQRNVINQATEGYADDAKTNVEQNLEEQIQKQQAARQEYIDSLVAPAVTY